MFERLKNDQRIPLAIMALLGLWLIIYLYDLASDFSVDQPHQIAVVQRVQPLPDVSQWHVFGEYNASLENLPETQLQLTLQGVMVALSKGGQSYAIIASPSVPAKAYKVGDTLPGDATLKQVMKNQIILNYQGVLQRLTLPIDTLQFATPSNE